jgi:hypothetical protein
MTASDEDMIRRGDMKTAIYASLGRATTEGAKDVLRLLILDVSALPAVQPVPDVAELVALLREAAVEIEAHVDAEWPEETRGKYPVAVMKYAQDMELVWRIEAALAAWENRHE